MSFERHSLPMTGPLHGARLAWTEYRPATESSTGVFVLRSPTTTMCVRAVTSITLYFHSAARNMATVRHRALSPTMSTSGLHSFAYSVSGAEARGWLDVATSRLSVAG